MVMASTSQASEKRQGHRPFTSQPATKVPRSTEKIVEAAKAINLANFSSYLERMLDELFIDRMEGNEEIFSRAMTDKEFRSAAHEHLAMEIFRRVRGMEDAN
jgi:type I restriction enzyme R subunit